MNASLKILIVDDDRSIQQMVRINLELAELTPVIADDGAMALRAMLQDPSLVILDIGLSPLPDELNGFQVLERIRQMSDVPVIMLTSKSADDDKVRAFELGADDYLTKPFSSRELLARVNAVLRRSRSEPTVHDLRVGEVSIDFVSRRVHVGDRQVHLSPTEFNLLAELARSANRIVSPQQLLQRVWGKGYEMEILHVSIWRLRNRLEPDASNPRYILRESGGYRLVD